MKKLLKPQGLGTGTLAKSKDPDEMQHYTSGSSLFAIRFCTVCEGKNNLHGQKHFFYRNFDQQPLKILNEQFHTYCMNMYGIICQNEESKCCMSL